MAGVATCCVCFVLHPGNIKLLSFAMHKRCYYLEGQTGEQGVKAGRAGRSGQLVALWVWIPNSLALCFAWLVVRKLPKRVLFFAPGSLVAPFEGK